MSKEIRLQYKNGVYKLNCKTIEEQYVFQNSNPLRIRMTGHWLSASKKKTKKTKKTLQQSMLSFLRRIGLKTSTDWLAKKKKIKKKLIEWF